MIWNKKFKHFNSPSKVLIYKIMLPFCLQCKDKTVKREGYKDKLRKANNFIAMGDIKKPKFIKEQQAGRTLSTLGINTHLSQIPLVGPHLF